MMTLELLLLGLALAVDAAVVTFALGVLHVDFHMSKKVTGGLLLCFTFGLMQFLMMWLGSYGGYLFSFSLYGHLFHFIVGAIFLLMAIKFLQESLKNEKSELNWGFWPVLVLSIVTSVDALFSGVSLGTLPKAYLPAMTVGGITFMLCLTFYFFSQIFKEVPERWLLRLSALIFIVLGGRIFIAS